MHNKNVLLATVGAFIGQTIFGLTFMFTKIALSYASPMVIVANRYMIAFLFMSVVVLLKKDKFSLKGKNKSLLLIMAIFQPVLYFICETYGIKYTTSTFSSVMIALIPVITLISAIPILSEIPSKMQVVFTLLSLAGVVVITVQEKSEGRVTFGGALILVGAVISAVAYNIISRRISTDFTAFERTYAMSFIGMVSFVLISLFQNISAPQNIILPFLNLKYLLCLFFLGVVASVGAFFFINNANTYLPVSKSTSFSCITTVVSVIAGSVILKEHMSLISYISAFIIIVGVLGVQLCKTNKE